LNLAIKEGKHFDADCRDILGTVSSHSSGKQRPSSKIRKHFTLNWTSWDHILPNWRSLDLELSSLGLVWRWRGAIEGFWAGTIHMKVGLGTIRWLMQNGLGWVDMSQQVGSHFPTWPASFPQLFTILYMVGTTYFTSVNTFLPSLFSLPPPLLLPASSAVSCRDSTWSLATWCQTQRMRVMVRHPSLLGPVQGGGKDGAGTQNKCWTSHRGWELEAREGSGTTCCPSSLGGWGSDGWRRWRKDIQARDSWQTGN
jgi:hypothetical protein